MAREVFKIVNNIAPTLIENLIALKRSQYCLRNEKTAVVPVAYPELVSGAGGGGGFPKLANFSGW